MLESAPNYAFDVDFAQLNAPIVLNLKYFLKKWAILGLFFVYFHSFSHRMDKYSTNLTINDKSVDGMLGSQTRGGRMEGTDESTELWLNLKYFNDVDYSSFNLSKKFV